MCLITNHPSVSVLISQIAHPEFLQWSQVWLPKWNSVWIKRSCLEFPSCYASFVCLRLKKTKNNTLLQRMHLCVLNYSSASKPPLSFTCVSGREILQHAVLRLISWSRAGGLRTEETRRVKLVKLKSPLSRLSLCLCHFGLFILVILLFLDSCFVSFWGFAFLAFFNWPVKAHFSYSLPPRTAFVSSL